MTTVLGEGYTLVTLDKSPETFKQNFKEMYEKEYIEGSDDSIIFGFIGNDNGDKNVPLYYTQQNYIMTSDGDTFSKIHYSPSSLKS